MKFKGIQIFDNFKIQRYPEINHENLGIQSFNNNFERSHSSLQSEHFDCPKHSRDLHKSFDFLNNPSVISESFRNSIHSPQTCQSFEASNHSSFIPEGIDYLKRFY